MNQGGDSTLPSPVGRPAPLQSITGEQGAQTGNVQGHRPGRRGRGVHHLDLFAGHRNTLSVVESPVAVVAVEPLPQNVVGRMQQNRGVQAARHIDRRGEVGTAPVRADHRDHRSVTHGSSDLLGTTGRIDDDDVRIIAHQPTIRCGRLRGSDSAPLRQPGDDNLLDPKCTAHRTSCVVSANSSRGRTFTCASHYEASQARTMRGLVERRGGPGRTGRRAGEDADTRSSPFRVWNGDEHGCAPCYRLTTPRPLRGCRCGTSGRGRGSPRPRADGEDSFRRCCRCGWRGVPWRAALLPCWAQTRC